jgi:hypothetical protein
MSWPRFLGAIAASAVALAFWWALTEPLPVPAAATLAVAGVILFCAGIIAGRVGIIAAPVGFLFSLFVGSLIATQLHQAFRPETVPVEQFNSLVSVRFPELLWGLAIAALLGATGGWLGGRLAR